MPITISRAQVDVFRIGCWKLKLAAQEDSSFFFLFILKKKSLLHSFLCHGNRSRAKNTNTIHDYCTQ